MSDTPQKNKRDIDISSLMDKIVEDTIGHIPVATPTPIRKIEKNKRVSRRITDTDKTIDKLSSKEAIGEEAKRLSPRKGEQPKQEVELFFPAKNKVTPAKVEQKKTPTKSEKEEMPKKTKQTPKQTPKQTKAGKPKQGKAQQSKAGKQTKTQVARKTNQQQPKQNKKQQSKPVKKQSTQSKSSRNSQPKGASTQKVKKKKHVVRNILLSFLGMVLLGALGVYGYFAYYYQDKFMPGTYINQIAAHELNAKQVEAQIRQRVEDYAIEVEFRGGEKESITGESIDYAFVSDGSIDKVLKEQNSLLWVLGYFTEYRHEVSESITFDEAKLEEEYKALPQTQRDNQEGPKDAHVFYQHKNWEIIPEVEGTTIDKKILFPAISDAIHASSRTCSAEEVKAYMEPKTRQDDPKLATEVNELNELVGASILYTLPQGEEVLDGNMLKLWIQQDENGRYTKDEAVFNGHVASYVERLADATDTIDKPKIFKTTSGKEVTVESKVYGWKIDRYTETEKLKAELATNAKVEREPEYAKREASMENNGFGDTYIEVDLTLQHLYVYRGGRLILESDIVSGRMTKSRWTPPGIFYLTNKQKNKVLRGPQQPDGSYEWESPVTYWMPFNRGIGFHDATWQSSFGGSRYLTRGSHGCINMPYKKAQALYDIITKEFPIICFYSEDYTVRNG